MLRNSIVNMADGLANIDETASIRSNFTYDIRVQFIEQCKSLPQMVP